MIKWLEDWYALNCDGDWEHTNGISIQTIDNPGWKVEIKICETVLEDKDFMVTIIERNQNDWVHCFLKDGFFKGRCGSKNLLEVLEVFKNWVET